MKLPRDLSGEAFAKALKTLGYQVDRNNNSEPDRLANQAETAEMLPEYDFSHAVRGNLRHPSKPFRAKIETPAGDRQVVIKTVEVRAVVNANREVTLQLPADISPGEHRITHLIEEDFIRDNS